MIRIRRLILTLMPVPLHLTEQALLILLGPLLDLLALRRQVVLQTLRVPGAVGLDDVVLPVVLDQVLEVLAVGGRGVGDVVVREPALQLRLVPFVVRYTASV